jgi:hypothetical protein
VFHEPKFETLKILAEFGSLSAYATPGVHSNPRFYKYFWRVFWEESPCEGEKFLSTNPLRTFEAIELIDRLRQAGKVHLIFVDRLPREGVSIWNYQSQRLKGKELALAYDDDPDPAIPSGHK